MQWNDNMDEAPRDGTEIVGTSRYGDCSIICWLDGRWIGMCDGGRSIEYQSDFGTQYNTPFITHWMPLTEPPR